MSAKPLNISISPELSALSWHGRSLTPVLFTFTNNDDRTITEARLCACRADLLPINKVTGESSELLNAVGETLIESGAIEARLSGGEWQSIDSWSNALMLGSIEPESTVDFEVRLNLPETITNQGKTGFSLMIAATDAYIIPEPVSLFYDNFDTYELDTYPSAVWTLKYSGSGVANQKITEDAYNLQTTKVLRLEGNSISIAESAVDLPAVLPEIIIVDVLVIPILGSSWLGSISLSDSVSETKTAEVVFIGGSLFIEATQEGNFNNRTTLTAFTYGNWCRVTIVCNTSTRLYDVYINKEIVASGLLMHQSITPNELTLTASNQGLTRLHFDNVGLYDGSVNSLDSVWLY